MDVEHLLAKADIRINGDRPWDIRVHRPRFYRRLALKGSLGAGESYVDGDWDAQKLDEAFFRLFRLRVDSELSVSFPQLFEGIRRLFSNPESHSRAFRVGKEHYDLDLELFKKMLDKHMVYSCGFWEQASTLDEAQQDKFKLIAKKLLLKPGMRVLDVGSGFGGLANWLHDHHHVTVDGITVSQVQLQEARRLSEGKRVHFELKDWRDIDGKWDRIVSVGQFEHVGLKNYSSYMKKMRSCLTEEGLFLLHTIGNDVSTLYTDPWIEKYIFPGGLIPSLKQISAALEGLFVLEDLHNFGADYDKTLMAWFSNFNRPPTDPTAPFFRKWSYYLLSSAAAFRARRLELWQLVLSPEGLLGGYHCDRFSF